MSKILEFLEKLEHIKPRGKGSESGYESNIPDNLVEEYFNDDSKTLYKVGDRVKKATYDYGDVHEKGTKGIITGAMYDQGREIYLAKFGDDMTVTLPYKLEPDN